MGTSIGVPLAHVQIVLARPSEPRNIGAVCRAAKASGIRSLTVISTTRIDTEAARPLAVSAADILDTARIMVANDTVAALRSAVASSTLVAGVSRRTGQKRKTVSFSPAQLADRAVALCESGAQVSLVFGNEQSGLSDEELAACNIAVSIETAPECPSLNLSHAVQVIAYEIYRAWLTHEPTEAPWQRGLPYRPIDQGGLAELVDGIAADLEAMGYPVQPGPQGMAAFLGDTLARAALSATEAKRLAALFRKLAGMHGRPGEQS